MGVAKTVSIVVGVVVALLVLLMCILLPVSIRDVNFDEFAVEYLNLERRVSNPEILTEGRYLRAPSTKLFKYKRTLQTISLTGAIDNVWCLTSEGLNMELDLTIQYSIIKEKVFDVFAQWGEEEDWKQYLQTLTVASVTQTCTQYSGEDFYFKRGEIERVILGKGREDYLRFDAFATLELVQLTNVAHPAVYQQATRQKQAIGQEKDRVLAVRAQNLTDVDTLRLKAIADAGIALTRALGQQQAILVQANITAQAEIQKWVQRANALKAVKAQLGDISNTELIDQYVRYIALVDLRSPLISVP